MLDILNNRVVALDKCLVPFLYPDWKVITDFNTLYADKVVYYLDDMTEFRKVKDMITNTYAGWSIVIPDPAFSEVNFKLRENLLEYLEPIMKTKLLQVLKTKAIRSVEEDYNVFIAMSVTLRKWYKEAFIKEEKLYKLYETLDKPLRDILCMYFDLSRQISPEVIFSGFIAFIIRISLFEEQRDSLSAYYKSLIAKNKFILKRIKQPLNQLINSNRKIPFEARLINFFINISKA